MKNKKSHLWLCGALLVAGGGYESSLFAQADVNSLPKTLTIECPNSENVMVGRYRDIIVLSDEKVSIDLETKIMAPNSDNTLVTAKWIGQAPPPTLPKGCSYVSRFSNSVSMIEGSFINSDGQQQTCYTWIPPPYQVPDSKSITFAVDNGHFYCETADDKKYYFVVSIRGGLQDFSIDLNKNYSFKAVGSNVACGGENQRPCSITGTRKTNVGN